MNTELKEKCDLLVKNRKIIIDSSEWDSMSMSLAAASLYTSKGFTVNPEKIKECERILYSRTQALSEFRTNMKIPLICKMTLSDDPEQYFKNVEIIFKLLSNVNRTVGNDYKIIASITICDNAKESEYKDYVDKTNEIYSRMKQAHKWLTSDEDISFAAVLAVSGLDIDKIIEEAEINFNILKEKKLSDKNTIRSLSHVLALDGFHPADLKCSNFEILFNELKSMKNHKFGNKSEFTPLGTLSLLGKDKNEIKALVAETDDYLKEQDGFSGGKGFIRSAAHPAYERHVYVIQLIITHFRPKMRPENGNAHAAMPPVDMPPNMPPAGMPLKMPPGMPPNIPLNMRAISNQMSTMMMYVAIRSFMIS